MTYLYFQLGFHHLTEAGAWDHQLFLALIALAYVPARWRKWIVLATLFALGHTSSIVAMSAGIFPSDLPWVEPAIVASLVVMALVELFALRQNPLGIARLEHLVLMQVLCFGFGLVHGLGFGAAFLSIAVQGSSLGEQAWALLAFTLGVESAQLLILLGLWIVAWAWFDLLQWRPVFWRKLLLVLIACLAVFHLLG